MKIRYQADADLNEDIVNGVLRREPGVDFQSADEAELRGQDDLAVLAQAALERRIVVSHDRRTMPGHFAEFIAGQVSPGLFIISQKVNVGTAIEELIVIWAASEAEEWVNVIRTVPL